MSAAPFVIGVFVAAAFQFIFLRGAPGTATVTTSNALLSLFFGGSAALVTFLFREDSSAASKSHSGGTTLASHPATYSYLLKHIGERPEDRALREKLEKPPRARMLGAPDEAHFFRWLLGALGAKRAVEVGVFRGLTTLQLARGVGAGGVVHAFDVDESFLDAGGRAAWDAAGVGARVKFREGPAVEGLRALLLDADSAGSFDFAFVDADKGNYDAYYELCLQLLRVGGVLAVDNSLWSGRAEHPAPGDEDSLAINLLNSKISKDPRVETVMLGMADGVYLCRKL